MNEQRKIFVSYASPVKDWVLEILRPKLLSWGASVCLDSEFEAGKDIEKNIVESVDKCEKVLVIISKEYFERYFTIYELCYANISESNKGGTKVIPILLERTDLPVSLANRTYIDLSDTSNEIEEWEKLKSIVKNIKPIRNSSRIAIAPSKSYSIKSLFIETKSNIESAHEIQVSLNLSHTEIVNYLNIKLSNEILFTRLELKVWIKWVNGEFSPCPSVAVSRLILKSLQDLSNHSTI